MFMNFHAPWVMESDPHIAGKVAGRKMTGFDVTQNRLLATAQFTGVDTAGVKSTSRRRIDRTGDITLENDALV